MGCGLLGHSGDAESLSSRVCAKLRCMWRVEDLSVGRVLPLFLQHGEVARKASARFFGQYELREHACLFASQCTCLCFPRMPYGRMPMTGQKYGMAMQYHQLGGARNSLERAVLLIHCRVHSNARAAPQRSPSSRCALAGDGSPSSSHSSSRRQCPMWTRACR